MGGVALACVFVAPSHASPDPRVVRVRRIARQVHGGREARGCEGGGEVDGEGDLEAAARELWRAAGIKVLPGAYMCAEEGGGENPGAPYIRVALVYDRDVTEAALGRIGEVLG